MGERLRLRGRRRVLTVPAPAGENSLFRGREGSALDGYVRTANDIPFTPDRILDRVERTYERQADEETADGQTGIESQVALAQIERVSEDIRQKADAFESREEALRERFAEVRAD